MELQWNDVSIEVVNKNKNIDQKHLKVIDNVSGYARSGKLTAMMGPSGGGKTTLLNALAGRIPPGSISNGSILIDGEPRAPGNWIHKCAYVDQDDQIFEHLTLQETIRYAAEFRLKHLCLSKDKIDRKINEIIKVMALSQVSKNKMNKLSGGQRKRALIGLELVTDPQIIFLDEPTSGLDAHTATSLVRFLRGLAREGRIVIMTIHQPSLESFLEFDNLVLVSRGKILYNAPADNIEEHLNQLGLYRNETVSIPDFLMEITNYISEDSSDRNPTTINYRNAVIQMIQNHEKTHHKSNTNQNRIANTKNEYYVEYLVNLKDICLLYKRRFALDINNKVGFAIKHFLVPFLVILGSTIILMLIANMIYNNAREYDTKKGRGPEQMKLDLTDILATIFYMCLYLSVMFVGVVSSGILFYPEKLLVRREMGVGSYSATSYYVSLLLYQLTKSILRNIIPAVLVLFVCNPILKSFFIYTLVFTPLVAIPFGLALGSISDGKRTPIFIVFIGVITICLMVVSVTVFLDVLLKNVSYSTLLILDILLIIPLSLFTPIGFYLTLFRAFLYGESTTAVWLLVKTIPLPVFIGISLINPVVLSLLSIILLGRILRPSIRMNLSKEHLRSKA